MTDHPAEADGVRYALDDGVARIALARPDRLNSLNGPMRRALIAAFDRAGAEARAVVLTGEGRAFCAGQDLGDAARASDIDLAGVLRDEYEPLLARIVDCPVPTLAAVNGVAAGAGANLALAADIVVAAHSASFVQAFARIGLIPDAGGTYWLPRLVGRARAMGLCLLTDPLPAPQAAEWGLIWEAVEDAAFEARVEEIALRLAEGPTRAFSLMKRAFKASAANDLETQLALEADLQAEAGASRDFMEGVAAFLEKRPPRFEGR